jgi:hypothetical protein
MGREGKRFVGRWRLTNYERATDHLGGFDFVLPNAIDIELCLRITNATTTFDSFVKATHMPSLAQFSRTHSTPHSFVKSEEFGVVA